jgi:hypothetical protein
VLWTRTCKTLTLFKFNWVSCIFSLNSSIIMAQVQLPHIRPRQWRRHCRCNWESVPCSESKITTRSRILSSILLNLWRSRKSNPRSDIEQSGSISLRTSAKVTRSDYKDITTALRAVCYGLRYLPDDLTNVPSSGRTGSSSHIRLRSRPDEDQRYLMTSASMLSEELLCLSIPLCDLKVLLE